MANFKVGDEIKVIDKSKMVLVGGLENGDECVVAEVTFNENVRIERKSDGKAFLLYPNELNYIELFKPKRTKNQRITALENEVAELKVIVHQLRKPSTDVQEALAINFEADADVLEFEGKQYRKVDREAREGDVVIIRDIHRDTNAFKQDKPYKVLSDREIKSDNIEHCGNTYCVYSKMNGRTPDNVDVYEVIVEDKQEGYYPWIAPTKTANEQRAEVIEKAKGFVESVIKRGRDVAVRGGKIGNVTYKEHLYVVDFATKENKVTALVTRANWEGKKSGANPDHVARAKCNPSDVFNEHIGKAIALGRALGLDVSEFEQAVQPNEVVLGHAISSTRKDGEYYEYPEVTKIEGKRIWGVDSIRGYNSFTDIKESYEKLATKLTIINDTNAQYTIPTGPAPVAER